VQAEHFVKVMSTSPTHEQVFCFDMVKPVKHLEQVLEVGGVAAFTETKALRSFCSSGRAPFVNGGV